MKIRYFLLFILSSPVTLAQSENPPVFYYKVSSIPTTIITEMRQYTWQKDCPVPLKDLAYLELAYWGFDAKTHKGHLIVNKELANEIVSIFKTLYEHQFPIQRMELIESFKGNDDASMAANNTSAFNCRPVTNRPGEYSQHSYGRAIDINPLINPYVNQQEIKPSQGINHVDRTKPETGKIVKGDLVYQEFIKHGWDWAGDWHDIQDYQHFEKRAHGEKRNPYGYK